MHKCCMRMFEIISLFYGCNVSEAKKLATFLELSTKPQLPLTVNIFALVDICPVDGNMTTQRINIWQITFRI